MMRCMTIAALAASLAGAATAQDWTGLYAGAQVGTAFSDDEGIFRLDPLTPGLATAFSPSEAVPDAGFFGSFDEGTIGGLHIGYDVQQGNIVYGGVLDLNSADFGDKQQGKSRTPAVYTIARSMDTLATLRGRVGYLATPKTLIYGTGGFAFGEVDFAYSQPGSAASTTTSGGQDEDVGYAIGIGAEQLVTERLSIGLEYIYVNMGGNDFTANLRANAMGGAAVFGTDGNSTNARGSDDDFDFGTVQLKVSYRF